MLHRAKRALCLLLSVCLAVSCFGSFAAAESILQLPENLTEIGEKAFCGDTSLSRVIVPDSAVSIRSCAFADSSLTEINLPDSLSSIANDAFSGSALQIIHVNTGTYASRWCDVRVDLNVPAPTCVTAKTAGNTSIAVSWEPAEFVDGYVILSENKEAAKVYGQDQTACTLKDLTPGQSYTFAVKSFVTSIEGEPAYSTAVSAPGAVLPTPTPKITPSPTPKIAPTPTPKITPT